MLADDGAVNFGRLGFAITDREGQGIYSQPNINLMQTSTLRDSDETLSSVCSDCELSARRGSDVTNCILTASIISSMCQESLEPNTTDLALKPGSLPYRHWILDKGMLIEAP
jgi:hypothetical protein